VGVIARFHTKPESAEHVLKAIQETMVVPTRSEPGCIRYELWQDLEDPTRLSMVEEWESAAALETHLALPSLQEAIGALIPFAASAIEVQRYRPQG